MIEARAPSLRGAERRSNPFFLCEARRIASRSLASGAHSRDPLARNDGSPVHPAFLIDTRGETANTSLKLERRRCEERSDEAIHSFFA